MEMRHIGKFIAAIMLLACPALSQAYDFEVDSIQYYVVDFANNTVKIVGTSKDDWGDFVIPSTVNYNGRELTVVSIGSDAFDGNKLKSVTIPKSVISISADAFSGCSKLNTVTFEGDYCRVNSYFLHGAFGGKKRLKINVPTLKAWCTYDLKDLMIDSIELYVNGKEVSGVVDFPIELKEVKPYTFQGQKNIKGVNLHEGITKIGEGAFARCGLTNITIPNSCDIICKNVFSELTLDELKIPSSVSYLEHQYFTHVKKLIFEPSDNPIELINNEDRGSIFGRVDELYLMRPIEEILYEYRTSLDYISCVSKLEKIEGLKKLVIGRNIKELGTPTFGKSSTIEEFIIEDSEEPITLKEYDIVVGTRPAVKYSFSTRHTGIPLTTGTSPLNKLYLGRNILWKKETGEEKKYYSYNEEMDFSSDIKSQQVEIGPNVTELLTIKQFMNCPLEKIIVNSTVPPTYPIDWISRKMYFDCKLYVPAQSITQYQNTAPWSNFWNIIAYDGSVGINNAKIDDDDVEAVYDLNGVKVGNSKSGLPKGVYIVVGRQGRKKILVE